MKERLRRPDTMPLDIDIILEAPAWESVANLEALARSAAHAAIEGADAEVADSETLSILFCDDARIQFLNRDFRGFDKPTNVLSFPAPDVPGVQCLGDIAIAWETVARETEDEGKSLADHVSHLIVHGVLHLLGYDHESDEEAEEMEALERLVLERLGIDDPYAEVASDPTP